MTNIMYHFAQVGRHDVPRLRYDDGRTVVVGETLTVTGRTELCFNGLHASPRIVQALAHKVGRSALTAVTLWGEMEHGDDKSCATHRTCHAMVDAETVEKRLKEFTFWCALHVAHLWDMPPTLRTALQAGIAVPGLLTDAMDLDCYTELTFDALTTAKAAMRWDSYDNGAYAAASHAICAISAIASSVDSTYERNLWALRMEEMEIVEAKLRELFPELGE